ncbi:hypothetical protein [Ruoffia tabacinasalis]|uniref:hypothetical protein n=1 Tax=Ruoffia tabacinasalis TaxID=87458 RepID=UPI0030D00C28
MKKLLILVTTLFTFLISTTPVNAQENLFGRYEVKGENTLIKEICITEDKLQVVLDNEQRIDSETQDKTHPKVLDFRNLMVNEDALYGVVDTSAQSVDANPEEIQSLEINFFDGNSFPTFSIDIIKPEYTLSNEQLIVKYRGDRIWVFDIEDDHVLSDENDVNYELVE